MVAHSCSLRDFFGSAGPRLEANPATLAAGTVPPELHVGLPMAGARLLAKGPELIEKVSRGSSSCGLPQIGQPCGKGALTVDHIS